MPFCHEPPVAQAMENAEFVRCVSIIGAHGHGKTSLIRMMASQYGLTSTSEEAEQLKVNEHPSGETTRTEVHMLLHIPSQLTAFTQDDYNPDSLRLAIRTSKEPQFQLAITCNAETAASLPARAQTADPLANKSRKSRLAVNSTDLSSPGVSEGPRRSRVSIIAPSTTSEQDSKDGSRRRPSHRKYSIPDSSSPSPVPPKNRASFLNSGGDSSHRPATSPSGTIKMQRIPTGPPRSLPFDPSMMDHNRPAKVKVKKQPCQKHASDPPLLLYILDTPGHADFAADVSSSLRLSDGVIVIVDVIEGCLAHLEVMLHQALAERVKPVLFVTGLDTCVIQLRMSPADVHARLCALIDDINKLLTIAADELLGDACIFPENGDAAFGSASQGWGINVKRFAEQYAKKFGLDADAMAKRLWNDSDASLLTLPIYERDEDETESGRSSQSSEIAQTLEPSGSDMLACEPEECDDTDPTAKPPSMNLMCALVLEPMAQLVRVLLDMDWPKVDAMLGALGMELDEAEWSLRGAALVNCVLQRWLDVSDVVVNMIRMRLPSPYEAQRYRVENLYGGLADDTAATAIRHCDPKGPLMVFVSRMMPTPQGRLFALGRVFSGTLTAGQKVWVRSLHRRGDVNDNRIAATVDRIALPLHSSLDPVQQIQCGNLCAIFGVDQFLLKAGDLTDCEDAAEMIALRFSSVRPVVRVAVKPTHESDLPKLTEALRRLSKVDPLAESTVEEWGEHLLIAGGRRHIDACLESLKENYEPDDFTVSVPNGDSQEELPGAYDKYHVAYRETVNSTLGTNARSVSPDGSFQVEAIAEPLSSTLCTDIEAGLFASGMDKDERTRALVDHYDWNNLDASRIWCFGSGTCSPNFVIDGSPNGSASSELLEQIEIRGAVTAACQWATHDGALCEELMRGIRFNIKNVALHGKNTQCGTGQMIGTTRRCFLAAQLGAAPKLQEPFLRCEVFCPDSCKDTVCTLLAERRGTLLSETPIECSNWAKSVRLMFEVPAADTLDLDAALREIGCTRPAQSTFAHWSSIAGDLNDAGRFRELVLGLRRWKQLEAIVPTPESIFGPGSKMTVADVFDDDLSDLVVSRS